MKPVPILVLAMVLMATWFVSPAGAQRGGKKDPTVKDQYHLVLVYRTGPFAPGGTGVPGGIMDYLTLVNMQGGVNGVMQWWEECDTQYKTDRGVECYERFKKNPVGGLGIPYVHPMSTGVAYALIERATDDKIPVFTLGFGRADAADGRVFPYTFPLMTTYWSQASAKIRYIAKRVGGEDKLKGIKIANLHLDHPYGRETIPILDALSKRFGFEVKHYPVPVPGIDQKSLWLDIARRYNPDFVINRNWGVSCTVPLKEAARLGYPRDRIIGVWWCGSEEDVIPAGRAAVGYITTTFHGVGTEFPVVQEILEKVYGTGQGNLSPARVGQVYWHRGLVFAMVVVEAMRTAQAKFCPGGKGCPVSGEQVQWGFENLNITSERIKELGAEGILPPFKASCLDHEGGVGVLMQQWDGQKWVRVSDWVEPYKDLVRAEVEKSAAKYAQEKKLTPRACPR
ncbi:MAG: ABC transporter substrate-binding protein [Nitrospirae bacterium]|nr:ABC transporter substrate-binding protein [Nitrospirota bacterium]